MRKKQLTKGVFTPMLVFAIALSTVLHPVAAQPTELRFNSEISRAIQYDEEHVYTLESEANRHVDVEVAQRCLNIGFFFE